MIKIWIKYIALEIKGIAFCLKLKKPVGTGGMRRRLPEWGAAAEPAQADKEVLPRHVIRMGAARVYSRRTRPGAR